MITITSDKSKSPDFLLAILFLFIFSYLGSFFTFTYNDYFFHNQTKNNLFPLSVTLSLIFMETKPPTSHCVAVGPPFESTVVQTQPCHHCRYQIQLSTNGTSSLTPPTQWRHPSRRQSNVALTSRTKPIIGSSIFLSSHFFLNRDFRFDNLKRGRGGFIIFFLNNNFLFGNFYWELILTKR